MICEDLPFTCDGDQCASAREYRSVVTSLGSLDDMSWDLLDTDAAGSGTTTAWLTLWRALVCVEVCLALHALDVTHVVASCSVSVVTARGDHHIRRRLSVRDAAVWRVVAHTN